METGEKKVAIEPVRAALHARQAIKDVLAVQNLLKPRCAICIHGQAAAIGCQIGEPRLARNDGMTRPSISVTP